MRKLLLLLALGISVFAQETRREQTNRSANPADDLKPNSDKIPDVYAIDGQFDRVITLRFKFDAELLAGLEKMVAQQKIRNAVIWPEPVPCAATTSIKSAIATYPRKICSRRTPTPRPN